MHLHPAFHAPAVQRRRPSPCPAPYPGSRPLPTQPQVHHAPPGPPQNYVNGLPPNLTWPIHQPDPNPVPPGFNQGPQNNF
ncbi:hypothetical protein EJ03DRAFT_326873 [Teratosphaeria nubilosa]|uniref:Uncharacterized protein n=1 Tax=Teratosphaeria nubilosa TaxID=161662 RepID=A0A6G1LAU8_9PEZI|nr:hypothetical protein EJ03DRAFT_326873 [Teratosphaeria nubilosa]